MVKMNDGKMTFFLTLLLTKKIFFTGGGAGVGRYLERENDGKDDLHVLAKESML